MPSRRPDPRWLRSAIVAAIPLLLLLLAAESRAAEPDDVWQQRLQRQVAARDPEVVPLLAEGIRQRPRMRQWALEQLVSMGPFGERALQSMGNEGVDLILLAFPTATHDQSLSLLKHMEPEASRHLFDLLEKADPEVRHAAANYLFQLQEPQNVDRLLAVAERHSDSRVRLIAAQAVGWLEPQKGTAPLIALLQDPSLARGAAEALAKIDGPRANDALARWLRDPAQSRSDRWFVAQRLRATGRPDAIRTADRYGPTGPQGQGNPESSFGAWLAAAIMGGALLVLSLLGRRGGLSVSARLAVVGVAVLGSYIGLLLILPLWVAWSSGAFLSSGRIHGLSGAMVLAVSWLCVFPTAAVWAARRMWRWQHVSALVVGVGSGLGALGGIMLHERIYWYVLQRSAHGSALTLATTSAAALLASYWPRGLIFPPYQRKRGS